MLNNKNQTPLLLKSAIAVNALSWGMAFLIYVYIFITAFKFGNQEEIDNVVAAFNLLWVIPLLLGLWKLWRNHRVKKILLLVIVTQSISLYYSIRSPVVTTLRYFFLEQTEATLEIVYTDIIISLVMAVTSGIYLIVFSWKSLLRP